MNRPMGRDADASAEIASTAARLIAEEGLSYGAAKRQALQQLNWPARTPLPSNDAVEAAVRDHIALFCADTQPRELRALRERAAWWMAQLAEFQPHLSGAVWHGTATRHQDIHLQLFTDDPKAVEIALINRNQPYDAHTATGFNGAEVEVLSLHDRCPGLSDGPTGADGFADAIGVHLAVHNTLALRGALQPDEQGRKPRGNAADVARLLAAAPDTPTADASA